MRRDARMLRKGVFAVLVWLAYGPVAAQAPDAPPSTSSDEDPARRIKAAIAEYGVQMMRVLVDRRLVRYPAEARMAGQTGEAEVTLKIGADGTVAAIDITRSSGAAILDDQARIAAARARTFARIPDVLRGTPFTTVLRIRFDMEPGASPGRDTR